MRYTINDNNRGFLFRKGRYVKMLEPGIHITWLGSTIEIIPINETIKSKFTSIDLLLKDSKVASQTVLIEVPDQKIALHFVNGLFVEALRPGRYLFWTIYDRHEFREVDVSTPEVDPSIPLHIFAKLPATMYLKVVVPNHTKGRLYFNAKYARLLEPGTYFYWQGVQSVGFDLADARQLQMNITGQEILTKDKVSLRLNLVCIYKIVDFVKIVTEIDDYAEQMRVAAQLAVREYVGKLPLDEILENKDQISAALIQSLKNQEAKFFVEIIGADVKDIILPGEIREIMNTVLIAEKRAQANVITRREEVASTRSLLNTAKLLEENQTLFKLKELEYVERIFEHVGSISLNGSGDLLSQLVHVIRDSK